MSNKYIIQCAGVIILDNNRTILVSTHKGNYSFPKGKRHKKESYWSTALREMEEETGIKPYELNFIDGIYIDEISKKGNTNIRYYVATIRNNINQFSFDSDELDNVSWYTKEEVLNMDKLKDSRKTVYLKALEVNKDPEQYRIINGIDPNYDYKGLYLTNKK
jgi:8-oxo-dGTP pyrophosphatase MutT (NUDIX family)